MVINILINIKQKRQHFLIQYLLPLKHKLISTVPMKIIISLGENILRDNFSNCIKCYVN